MRISDWSSDVCSADLRLGRDAAPVEANAAKILALDDCGLEAQLRRADRRNIAAGAGAEDDAVVVGVSHLNYSFLYKFNGRIQRIELPAETCRVHAKEFNLSSREDRLAERRGVEEGISAGSTRWAQ